MNLRTWVIKLDFRAGASLRDEIDGITQKWRSPTGKNRGSHSRIGQHPLDGALVLLHHTFSKNNFIWKDSSTGVPKLWTSTFLMYFGVLNLVSENQIWKFKYKYFGKFSEFEFNKYHGFWTLDFYRIKIGLSLKSLGTTVLR